ncbi:triosephosphate isomerase [Candidatus Mycoplasma haematohominis]|uniref:Triosephosphate isomerase n=2 Tax=Candidatus Mycoplasma haematohominis TaxID=1494318 RepID=A0A478FQ18_9MOLU|nr:triosephosphate isomerase [Candidatus Mycoplasma haemohominis]
MNFLYRDFQNYIEEMRILMAKEPPKTLVGIAVPYIYLKEAAQKVGADIKVLAQDLHPADKGAFTSQISAAQIASIEVPATLIGHSECRALSQNAIVITNKVRSALDQGLEVIYCCGKDPVNEVTEELKSLSEEDWKKVIIAYEPISAIGSGSAMDASTAAGILRQIKDAISMKWGAQTASTVRFLYGGSVNAKNYKTYLDEANIDGVLVGGASLKIEEFWDMATLK